MDIKEFREEVEKFNLKEALDQDYSLRNGFANIIEYFYRKAVERKAQREQGETNERKTMESWSSEG